MSDLQTPVLPKRGTEESNLEQGFWRPIRDPDFMAQPGQKPASRLHFWLHFLCPGTPPAACRLPRKLASPDNRSRTVVELLSEAYDTETAKAWLFGTNTRLDDQTPIEMLRAAEAPERFTAVVRAARQLASFQT